MRDQAGGSNSRPDQRSIKRLLRLGLWGLAMALVGGMVLEGCANPNFVPPGSRPFAQIQAYPAEALAQDLSGNWRVQRRQQPPQTAYAANLLQRAAEVENIAGWEAMNFLPTPRTPTEADPGVLVIRDGKRSMKLNYWIEGNLVAMAPSGNHTMAHSHWEAVTGAKTLLLRSLDDGEVISLVRSP